MNDALIRELGGRAGIAVEWLDYADRPHRVSVDAIRRILLALDLPCESAGDIAHSRRVLDERQVPLLVTATAGVPITLPVAPFAPARQARLVRDDGGTAALDVESEVDGIRLPAIDTPGYHALEIGAHRITLAVAPRRCVTVSDLAPHQRVWGLAAQIYGLRSPGDCGIGDMAGAAGLAGAAAGLGADAIALSPTHALFAADPGQFSPYAPSNRLFYNPLHGDPGAVLGAARVAQAWSNLDSAELAAALESRPEIDWESSARLKMRLLRQMFAAFSAHELAATVQSPLADDFAQFRENGGAALAQHATFEALHAARLKDGPAQWCWKNWPTPWRDPQSAAVRDFAEANRDEISFHCFLQWIADRSFGAAQRHARQAGMRIGMIADVAIGTNICGSHCWSSQDALLGDLEIGAPPDLFNANGQNWGLTTFSPRALIAGGFRPFIDTVRACMRHSGGVRIDHAMGLMRLWVIPHGAKASEGAYLAYPLRDLLRLIALESHCHRAIIVGEDLGMVPRGFRDEMAEAGMYGMRVLWFERESDRFLAPSRWQADAVAMTSTHDLPTVAGWWAGRDIAVRAQSGISGDVADEDRQREADRKALWRAFRSAKAATGPPLPPDQGEGVADAAAKFIAATPSRLALLPLEDALALKEQPNLPGTIDEHPNWRRRYAGPAKDLLDDERTRSRCEALERRKRP